MTSTVPAWALELGLEAGGESSMASKGLAKPEEDEDVPQCNQKG